MSLGSVWISVGDFGSLDDDCRVNLGKSRSVLRKQIFSNIFE